METAALLSLAGARSVVGNQWPTLLQDNVLRAGMIWESEHSPSSPLLTSPHPSSSALPPQSLTLPLSPSPLLTPLMPPHSFHTSLHLFPPLLSSLYLFPPFFSSLLPTFPPLLSSFFSLPPLPLPHLSPPSSFLLRPLSFPTLLHLTQPLASSSSLPPLFLPSSSPLLFLPLSSLDPSPPKPLQSPPSPSDLLQTAKPIGKTLRAFQRMEAEDLVRPGTRPSGPRATQEGGSCCYHKARSHPWAHGGGCEGCGFKQELLERTCMCVNACEQMCTCKCESMHANCKHACKL